MYGVAPYPLNEPDDRPREVVIHDNVAILKVLPLAEHIRGYEDPNLVLGLHAVALPVACRGIARGS